MVYSKEYFRRLKKADLHTHLSGCLRVSDIREIYEQLGLNISQFEPLEKHMNFFDSVLWDIILKNIMTSPKGLYLATKRVLQLQANDGVIASDMIINAGSLIKGEQDPEKTFEALNKAITLEYALHGVNSKIRLGANRRNGVAGLEKIADLYVSYKQNFMSGIDLNGLERDFPTSDFKEVLGDLKKRNIPFTIHAGEFPEQTASLRDALIAKPIRIGHGIAAAEDEEIIKLIKDSSILLELCPTSNIATGSYKNILQHPIRDFILKNIPLIICTDDPGVFNTSLSDEYFNLYQAGVKLETLEYLADFSVKQFYL